MTSSSPFAPYANAALFFKVLTGNLVADENGNSRPEYDVIEVLASLNQKQRFNTTPTPGVDPGSVWLEGRATNPMLLPDTVSPNAKAAAVWNSQTGYFYREPTARSTYGVDAIAGDKLRGYFAPGTISIEDLPSEPPDPVGSASSSDGQQRDIPRAAAIALSALRLCIADDAGKLIYATSANPDHAFLLGMTTEAVNADASTRVLTDGAWTDSSWNWQPNRPIFAGINGLLTQAPPTSGFLLIVAKPTSSTSIDFEIQEPILL